MNFRQFLNESPFVGGSTDFGLGTAKINKEHAEKYLKDKPTEIYEETDKFVFARFGSYNKGVIAYIDKIDKMLLYIVEFEQILIKEIHKSMTQTKVWRSDFLTKKNMAESVFNMLIDHTGTICSDMDQTIDGKRFWKRQMSVANENGYIIGLWESDLEDSIEWFDSDKEKFPAWAQRVYPTAWSDTDGFAHSYRFIISKNKF